MVDHENTNPSREIEGRGNTLLHEAAARGDYHSVETLLASGADIHARNARGETALHRSALRGNKETTQTLINAGAQVNARTRQGDTPLHLSAWSGNHENIAALIQGGADRSARNHSGETPAEVAIGRDHKGAMTQGLRTARTDKKMAFLDWMKDKRATQQQAVAKTAHEQKQEAPVAQRAKEMYAQQAELDKAAEQQIGPELQTRAVEVGERINKATAHLRENAPAPSAEGSGTNAALLQNAMNQDKPQAALSPTDNVKGQTALQTDKPEPTQAKTAPTRKPAPTRDGWSRGR